MLISNDILGKSDVKLKVEENGSEPMHDLNLKEEIQSYEITQDNKLAGLLFCQSEAEPKIKMILHNFKRIGGQHLPFELATPKRAHRL